MEIVTEIPWYVLEMSLSGGYMILSCCIEASAEVAVGDTMCWPP